MKRHTGCGLTNEKLQVTAGTRGGSIRVEFSGASNVVDWGGGPAGFNSTWRAMTAVARADGTDESTEAGMTAAVHSVLRSFMAQSKTRKRERYIMILKR